MSPEFLAILPNLSIGVVAVLSLAYLSLKHADTQKKSQEAFIKTLDDRASKHEDAMQERENALRLVEKEIRGDLMTTINRSNQVIAENGKVLERVVSHLNSAH